MPTVAPMPLPAPLAAALTEPVQPSRDSRRVYEAHRDPIRQRAASLLADKYDRCAMIGIELETVSTTNWPSSIASCAPATRIRRALEPGAMVAAETDASLGPAGVEFVEALPRHPESWIGDVGAQWALMARRIAASGGTSWADERCGLHVNVSIGQLPFDKGRLAWHCANLINAIGAAGSGRLLTDYSHTSANLKTLTGRMPNRYCNFPGECNDTHEKYRTVASHHGNRLEFRCWKGTLNPTQFIGAALLSHLVMHHAGALCIGDTTGRFDAVRTMVQCRQLLTEVRTRSNPDRPNAYNVMYELVRSRTKGRAIAWAATHLGGTDRLFDAVNVSEDAITGEG